MERNHYGKKVVLEERPTWKEELQKIKPLSFSDRLWYIWQYYKFHIAVCMGIIALICMLVTVITNAQKETVLSGIILNVEHNPVNASYLEDSYLDYLGESPKHAVVSLRTDMTIDVSGESGDLQSSYNLQILSALLSAGTEDFLLCTADTIFYVQQISGGIIADLSQVLSEDTFQTFENEGLILESNQFVYLEDGSIAITEDLFPAAIDISGTHFIEGYGIAENTPVYLCFLQNSPTPEHFATMVDYLFYPEQL